MFKFLILIFLSFSALAEPIEFVVTTAVGGPVDTVTRSLAKELEKNTDLKFVVVNKPGAGHNIGYQYIHESKKPTIFVSSDTLLTNSDKDGYPKGIINEIEPIFFIGDFSNIIFVNSDSNIKNINDLIKLSKKRDIKFGHGGFGTYSHQSMKKICDHTIKCLEVPYKSAAPGMVDLLTDTIDAYSLASFGSELYLENPKFRPIMIFSNRKPINYEIEILPEKLKKLEIVNWVMLFSKNLSGEDTKKIVDVLKSKEDKYYTNLGVWYTYKNPKLVWSKSQD